MINRILRCAAYNEEHVHLVCGRVLPLSMRMESKNSLTSFDCLLVLRMR